LMPKSAKTARSWALNASPVALVELLKRKGQSRQLPRSRDEVGSDHNIACWCPRGPAISGASDPAWSVMELLLDVLLDCGEIVNDLMYSKERTLSMRGLG